MLQKKILILILILFLSLVGVGCSSPNDKKECILFRTDPVTGEVQGLGMTREGIIRWEEANKYFGLKPDEKVIRFECK